MFSGLHVYISEYIRELAVCKEPMIGTVLATDMDEDTPRPAPAFRPIARCRFDAAG